MAGAERQTPDVHVIISFGHPAHPQVVARLSTADIVFDARDRTGVKKCAMMILCSLYDWPLS